jgi:hypothetical protein
MNEQIIKATGQVICDEVAALLKVIELTGTVPKDRIEGLKTRFQMYKEVLK